MRFAQMKFFCTIFVVLFAANSVSAQGEVPIRVNVNKVELAYVERGKGEAVILLHGGQADHRAWQYAMESLSANYRVISYSRRYNYPNKNPIVGNNHSAYIEAEDLAAFIDKLKLKRIHFVGTSIGAYTALIYSVKNPKRVLTLTVAEPNIHAWVINTPEFKDFFATTWTPAAAAFRANDDRAAMRILVDGFGGAGAFEKMTPAAQAVAMQNAHFFRAATLSVDHSPDIDKEKVRGLKMPVLLVRGENTKPMLRLIVEEFARVLPSAELFIVKSAGHGSPREKPREFTAAVADFLSRHRRR